MIPLLGMIPLLAAQDLGPYLVVLGLMILVLMLATGGLMVFRSRVLGKGGDADAGAGLLQNLRAMRDRGEISMDEYDAARHAMVAKAAARKAAAAAEGDDAIARKLSAAGIKMPVEGLSARDEGGLKARPGYDLTGQPLPGTKRIAGGGTGGGARGSGGVEGDGGGGGSGGGGDE